MEKETVKNLYLILGDDINKLLKDENIKEIFSNGNGNIYVTDMSDNKKLLDIKLETEASIEIVKNLAKHSETWTDEIYKIVLPYGETFTGFISKGYFLIQKKGNKTYELEDFISETDDNKKEELKNKIIGFLKENKNILIIGERRTGKTSFQDVLIKETDKIDNESKIAILENKPEIVTRLKNNISFITNDMFGMNELIVVAMRFFAGKIITDELKTGEDINNASNAQVNGKDKDGNPLSKEAFIEISQYLEKKNLFLGSDDKTEELLNKLHYAGIDMFKSVRVFYEKENRLTEYSNYNDYIEETVKGKLENEFKETAKIVINEVEKNLTYNDRGKKVLKENEYENLRKVYKEEYAEIFEMDNILEEKLHDIYVDSNFEPEIRRNIKEKEMEL